MSADRSWIYRLDERAVEELERALDGAKAAGRRPTELSPHTFQLPAAAPLFESLRRQLEHGRGMALLRSVPTAGKSMSDCELLYDGLACHLGTSIVQDTTGTLIDHVEDRGLSYDDISVRGYTTNAQLTPHCDSGDIVALLCIHQAKAGGINRLSSSLAVYNELLAYHDDALETLYRGFYYNVRGNGPPGKYRDITSHRVPVYLYHEGRLSCRFNQKAILTSEQLAGAPPLTEQEKSAIDKVATLSMDSRFTIDVLLQPGDLLLLCNHTVFHNRSSFQDGDAPHEKRLLLRKWINLPDTRPLTWDFGDHYHTGIRQGPFVAGAPGQIVVHDSEADSVYTDAP